MSRQREHRCVRNEDNGFICDCDEEGFVPPNDDDAYDKLSDREQMERTKALEES